MKIINEFNFRSAKEIIQQYNPNLLKEVYEILNNEDNKLDLDLKQGKTQKDTSKQIKQFFLNRGWHEEISCKSIPEMKYDLVKDESFPIEIEVGHMRLIYADFFEFLADYSKELIKAGIMIVCYDPLKFGPTWHNSIKSTARKMIAIKESFLVPILVIGIDP